MAYLKEEVWKPSTEPSIPPEYRMTTDQIDFQLQDYTPHYSVIRATLKTDSLSYIPKPKKTSKLIKSMFQTLSSDQSKGIIRKLIKSICESNPEIEELIGSTTLIDGRLCIFSKENKFNSDLMK